MPPIFKKVFQLTVILPGSQKHGKWLTVDRTS